MTPRTIRTTRRHLMAGSAGLAAAAAIGAPIRALGQGATPAATPVAAEAPDMTGAAYEFQVGAFTCWSVSDGAETGPVAVAVALGGMAQEDAQAILEASGVDPSQFVVQHTSTVVDTGDQLVLVDTGSGAEGLPETGILVDNLRRIGIQPTEIDVVVLTHGHPDHIGGTVTASGNPLYSNARYVMAQEDWGFWTDAERVQAEAPPELVDVFLTAVENNLLPLEGMIELIGFDAEIVPGITSVDARGHTPGHMGLLVESDGEQLWVLGDAALNTIDIPYPHAIGLPDTNPEQVIETRQRLYSQVADTGELAVFNHFHPFPSLGEIVSDGDTWAWRAVEATTEEEG